MAGHEVDVVHRLTDSGVRSLAAAIHGDVPIGTLRGPICACPTFHRALEPALRELGNAATQCDESTPQVCSSAGHMSKKRVHTHGCAPGTATWRCRESNPGPLAPRKAFSVRSPLCRYSAPPILADKTGVTGPATVCFPTGSRGRSRR